MSPEQIQIAAIIFFVGFMSLVFAYIFSVLIGVPDAFFKHSPKPILAVKIPSRLTLERRCEEHKRFSESPLSRDYNLVLYSEDSDVKVIGGREALKNNTR